METTKRPRIIYLLLAAMFIVTAAVAMPTTNAKYTTTKSYVINIESKVKQVIVNAYVVANTTKDETAKTVTLPYDGYYLIVAKGGDGADGMETDRILIGIWSDWSWTRPGGIGGTVYGIYHATANQKLYLYSGTAGVRAKGQSAGGSYVGSPGGTNSLGRFNGGAGTYILSADSAKASSTENASSGGGGAGSAVYLNDPNGGGTLLMVAGGGGAGASWNKKYTGLSYIAGTINAVEAGVGGDGGSIKNQPDSGSSDKIYFGADGTGGVSGSNATKGLAGTASGGSGGKGIYVETGGRWSNVIVDHGISAAAGSDFAGGGNGGNARALGGGGGGGYCGGGGGAGTSFKYASGGGGGGSSLISGLLAINDSSISTYVSRAKSGSTNLPPQTSGTDDDGYGYVIVYYLGSEYNPPA